MTAPDERPILVAYDGSDDARAAVERAIGLLQPRRVIVICVWAPIAYAVPAAMLGISAGMAVVGAEGVDADARERAQQLAAEGADIARRAGLEVEARAIEAEGSAWHGIVGCARELDAAVIVTGTRGRSGMAATFLGSTALGVLHHAHRPVLVVTHD